MFRDVAFTVMYMYMFVCMGGCFDRYVDYRTPPWDEEPYVYTAVFWHVLAAQFIFVVAFEVSLSIKIH